MIAETSSNSSQDRVLMSNALVKFRSKHYTECLELLNKLELNEAPGINAKVEHNRAVAEFYINGFRKHANFTQKLNTVLAKLPSDEPINATDSSLWIPLFNKALVHFNLRQPQTALKILLPLMLHLTEMDDDLATRSALLTINILLNTYQVQKAGILIGLLKERLPDLAKNEDEEYDEPDDRIDRSNERLDTSGTSTSDEAPNNLEYSEQARWMFDLYQTRWNVLSGKNFQIPTWDSYERSVFQAKVLYYGINDQKAAKEVSKRELNNTTELSVLRARQFYNGIDYQMAAKELSREFTNVAASIEKQGEDHNTLIANNMGIVHFHVRHYAMAVRFFQHALTFDQDAASAVETKTGNTELPIHCLGATKRPEILYNLGVSMLHLQRPKEAFECLLVPLNYYHNNPRIWLRLAEACIMVHNQENKSKENKNIVSSVIGAGVHRKYVIKPTPLKYVSNDSQSFAIPSTNLEFASLCLRNALTLVEFHAREFKQKETTAAAASDATDKSNDTATPTGWTEMPEKSECSPSKPPTQQTMNNLMCAILAAYSYVQITLGEYVLALKYATQLISVDSLPDAYAMLGHLYCAEALIMLDRVDEARHYLEPKFIAELKEDDFIHRGSPDWNITSLDAAQSILKYNLAVTLLLHGEIELARTVLNKCNHPIVLTHMKMMKVYMELLAGNVDNCRAMIRMDTPQNM